MACQGPRRTVGLDFSTHREEAVLMATFLVVAVAILLAAYLVALGRMVHANRPATPPRSHPHELDPWSERLRA